MKLVYLSSSHIQQVISCLFNFWQSSNSLKPILLIFCYLFRYSACVFQFAGLEAITSCVTDLFPRQMRRPWRREIFLIFFCSFIFIVQITLATEVLWPFSLIITHLNSLFLQSHYIWVVFPVAFREESTSSSCLTTIVAVGHPLCLCALSSVWLSAGPLVGGVGIMPRFSQDKVISNGSTNYHHDAGADRMCDAVEDETGQRPWLLYKLCWRYFTPLICTVSSKKFSVCK